MLVQSMHDAETWIGFPRRRQSQLPSQPFQYTIALRPSWNRGQPCRLGNRHVIRIGPKYIKIRFSSHMRSVTQRTW